MSQERRWRWSTEEKPALVRETYEPDMNVSLAVRKHGVSASQLFNLRKLEREDALIRQEFARHWRDVRSTLVGPRGFIMIHLGTASDLKGRLYSSQCFHLCPFLISSVR